MREVAGVDDERERFMAAMHKMRDAFQVLKEAAPWGAYDTENGSFYDGYAEVKRIFGVVLLQRDVASAEPPTWREMLPARLKYYRERARRRWRIVTFRCPACPKRARGPHKFGCSLRGKDQPVISMVRRSRGWDDP